MVITDCPLRTRRAQETLAFVNIKGLGDAKVDCDMLDYLISARLRNGHKGDIADADPEPPALCHQSHAVIFVVSVKHFYNRTGFAPFLSNFARLKEVFKRHGKASVFSTTSCYSVSCDDCMK